MRKSLLILLSLGLHLSACVAPPLPEIKWPDNLFVCGWPFPAGTETLVLQGNDTHFTHHGRQKYAWDFALPIGHPIVAVADGRVTRVHTDFGPGGNDISKINQSNWIEIDHGQGVRSYYGHLKQHSQQVKRGDWVKAGTVIGLNGISGFSTEPHLHFMVVAPLGHSIPIQFQDAAGFYQPGHREAIKAAALASISQSLKSNSMWPDTFTNLGLAKVAGIPGWDWDRQQSYRLTMAELPAYQACIRKVVFSLVREDSQDVAFQAKLKRSPKAWSLDLPARLVPVGFWDVEIAVDYHGQGWRRIRYPVEVK